MKESDAFLRDHVTALLRAEGFRKTAHTYRQALPGGDWIVVGFTGFPLGKNGSFLVHVAFVPQPLLEMHNFRGRLDKPPVAQWGHWALPLHPPKDIHADLHGWVYDTVEERQRCAEVLQDSLRKANRGLRLLADRDVLLDVVEAPLPATSADLRAISTLNNPSLRMALLAERGPSAPLQEHIDFFASGPLWYDRWAVARLAKGRPLDEALQEARQPRGLERYQPVRASLEAALDRWVTPALVPLGFRRCASGYERISASGDRAGIDLRLCWTSDEQTFTFHVVTGLDVKPSAEFVDFLWSNGSLGGFGARTSKRRTVSWLVSAVHPTPTFSPPAEALSQLGLHPWTVPTDRLDEGFRLLALVLAEASAPFLNSMLDRRVLLDFLDDPAHQGYLEPWSEDIRAALLLMDDESRRADLDLRLGRILENRHGHHHEAFLAWAQERSAR